MKTLRRSCAASLVVIATLTMAFLGGPRVLAQEPQEDAAYASTIDRAVVEFSQGHWEEAYALFRRAHELSPNARTWRGLGVSAFELRQYVEATADLEASLVDPRKPLTPEQREQVQGLIERAREFVSVYRVHVRPSDAEIVVDGKPAVLRDGQLHLDPGRHTIVVRAAGHEERRAELQAGAGGREDLSLELSVVPADAQATQEQPAPPTIAPTQTTPEHTRRGRRVWTWSLAGASVAAAAVATGLRLRVSGLVDEHHACVLSGGGTCQDTEARGKRFLKGSYVTAGLSGALLAGAVVSFFLEDERAPGTGASAMLSVSPQGLHVCGAF